MRGLGGKQAVVTGAASGIGRAIVHRLLEEGASVVGVDLRPAEGQDELEGTATWISADVSSEEAIRSLFDEVRARWGGLDVLCNAAGVIRAGAPLADSTLADFEFVMDVNAAGPYLCMKYGIPLLQARGGGSIVNLASTQSILAQPGAVSYSASKGAVLMMTRVAALEYARQNIRVNAILPGTTDTPLVRQGISAEDVARLEGMSPIGRLGRPEEIAAMAAFLASDECPFATGAPFIVDGGRTTTA